MFAEGFQHRRGERCHIIGHISINVIKLESTEGSIERNRKMGKVIPR